MSVRYTYGESDAAAQRLALVAQTFESSTESFLRRVVTRPPELAVDLGCGPGFTTRLIARATGARRVVGLDRSDAFLRRARGVAPAEELHDLLEGLTTPRIREEERVHDRDRRGGVEPIIAFSGPAAEREVALVDRDAEPAEPRDVVLRDEPERAGRIRRPVVRERGEARPGCHVSAPAPGGTDARPTHRWTARSVPTPRRSCRRGRR